ncbi:MAG: hypothetical protein ACOX1G_07315 [bacterium]|jgi:hypothetical protein|nr:hypothetical protein [bacterium]
MVKNSLLFLVMVLCFLTGNCYGSLNLPVKQIGNITYNGYLQEMRTGENTIFFNTGDRIKFYNKKNMAIVYERAITKNEIVFASDNAEYFISVCIKADSNREWGGNLKIESIRVYDFKGNLLRDVSDFQSLSGENYPTMFISNSGKTIVSMDYENGGYAFYQGTKKNFSSMLEFTATFSKNGETFAINGSAGEKSFFVLLNDKGDVIEKTEWPFVLENDGSPGEILLGENLAILIRFSQGIQEVVKITKNQIEIIDKGVMGYGHLAWNDKQNLLAIATDKVKMIDLQSKSTLWSYMFNMQELRIDHIALSSSKTNYTLVSGTTAAYRAISGANEPRYVYLFDRSGNLIWNETFDGHIYNNMEHSPWIAFLEDKRFIVGLPDKAFLYVIK